MMPKGGRGYLEDDRDNNKKNGKRRNNHNGRKTGYARWVFVIIAWTFVLSILISFISSTLLGNVGLVMAFIILILIIFMGILFDIIGIAVAAASEVPFHSMAAQSVPGAKQAVRLIKNADKVSNFCSDVVGDIAGIISGATSASIVLQIAVHYDTIHTALLGLILTGIVASLTVGGKAVGKYIAISKNHIIMYKVGIIVYYASKIRDKTP